MKFMATQPCEIYAIEDVIGQIASAYDVLYIYCTIKRVAELSCRSNKLSDSNIHDMGCSHSLLN